jgi:hypothetical protein
MGDDEARVVMNHVDTNKDGTIDFEEFYTWFTADEFRADRAHALVRRLQGFRIFAMLDGSDQRAAAAKVCLCALLLRPVRVLCVMSMSAGIRTLRRRRQRRARRE